MKIAIALTAAIGLVVQAPTASAATLWSALFPAECGTQIAVGAGVGGVAGGLIGNRVADKNRDAGAAVGAAVGAFLGSQVGRSACQTKLRREMIRQAAMSNASVEVPAGERHPSMVARPRLGEEYTNARRQQCKIIDFDPVGDGSAPSQSVRTCETGPGVWEDQPAVG